MARLALSAAEHVDRPLQVGGALGGGRALHAADGEPAVGADGGERQDAQRAVGQRQRARLDDLERRERLHRLGRGLGVLALAERLLGLGHELRVGVDLAVDRGAAGARPRPGAAETATGSRKPTAQTTRTSEPLFMGVPPSSRARGARPVAPTRRALRHWVARGVPGRTRGTFAPSLDPG